MFHLFDWLITPVLWRTRYLNTCELTSGNKRSPFSPGWSILIKAVGIFCCHLLIIWFLFLLFDVFYCINNIVRVNVSRYKFLYRFEFFWKKFFWECFLCLINNWLDPGRFPFQQNERVLINLLSSVSVSSKKLLSHPSIGH